MVCPKCGRDNADKALFCAGCGAKLDAPIVSAQVPVETPRVVDSTPLNSEAPAVPQQPVYSVPVPETRENFPVYTNTPAQMPPQAQGFPVYEQPPVQPQPQYMNNNAGNYPQPYGYQPQPYNGYPPYGYRPGQEKDWAAITSLICGILSLPCCFTVYGGIIAAIAAIVFGIIGLKSSKRSMSITGLCLGAVGLLLVIFIIVLGVFSVMEQITSGYYY